MTDAEVAKAEYWSEYGSRSDVFRVLLYGAAVHGARHLRVYPNSHGSHVETDLTTGAAKEYEAWIRARLPFWPFAVGFRFLDAAQFRPDFERARPLR